MLSEEALIVLAAFGACGMLVLGVLELLWPSRPRHAVHRPPPASDRRTPRPHRTSAWRRHTLEPGRSPYRRRGATDDGLAPGPTPSFPSGPSALADAPALLQANRHAAVMDAAAAALERAPGPSETAALWSVLAAAHEARGEASEARVALEAAISVAPVSARAAYLLRLAVLAERVARERLADAERRAVPDSEGRLGALRGAAVWLDCARAAAPNSAALAALDGEVQARLWPAWERAVMALVQRQDYRAARRLLRDALADPAFPAIRGETFRALFSGTFSGELGQLTARAIKSVQDAREADALAALGRAEDLLGVLSDEALPPRRREEVDHRLWWGYRALGERRLAAGEFEEALEPLLHAFGYPVGPESQQQTRALLLRALDGVADTRAPGIRELADAGDRAAAVVQFDELRALLRSASETGLSFTELAGVSRKVERLLESLQR